MHEAKYLAEGAAILLKAAIMRFVASAAVGEAALIFPNFVRCCPRRPAYPAQPIALASDLSHQ